MFIKNLELNNLNYELDNKWSTLTIKFDEDLFEQSIKLKFDFVGELNNKMEGFSR